MVLIGAKDLSITKAFAAFCKKKKSGQIFSSCYLTSIQMLLPIIIIDTLTIAQLIFTLKLKSLRLFLNMT